MFQKIILKTQCMKNLLYILLVVMCWSCSGNSGTEKHQGKRNNVVNVKEKITEIEIDDVLIGSIASPAILGNYLIIGNPKTIDELIYIFDKNNFQFITGTAVRGLGPGEIANMGHLETDEASNRFYVSDHGKQVILSYHLDSVLANPDYMPDIKMTMREGIFPAKYQYINDTLCFGLIIEPIGQSDFKQSVGKWNMNTGEIKLMEYSHPKIEKKRISFAVSMENGIYVECYDLHDLMTICDLNGGLLYNIYGPNWTPVEEKNRKRYFGNAIICNNTILAAYSGGEFYTDDRLPTKFMFFDINGDYKKTIETGYKILRFCFDKENNRLILNLDDVDIQFAYLDLTGLID